MFRFIFIHGAFMWGVSTALLTQLIISMTSNGSTTLSMLDSLVIFPMCGAIWGFFMWREHALKRRSPERTSSGLKTLNIK